MGGVPGESTLGRFLILWLVHPTSMTTAIDTQIDLFVWARDLEGESKRIAEIDAEGVGANGAAALHL